MHELAIVDALIQQVESEVRRAGSGGRVTRLDVVVGRLSGVCADSLRFAFEMLAPGTLVEAARLQIEEPKAVCSCSRCGKTSEIDDLTGSCPHCGSNEVRIVGGQDLLLQSIELEENSP